MRRHRTSKGRFTKRSSSPKRRKSRRRKNGGGLGRSAFLALMAKGKAKAARKSPGRRKVRKVRKAARKSRVGRRIRPTVILAKTGRYYRPRRSKYFTRPRRINRRRRNGMGGSIVSGIKRVFTVSSISNYISIGGGIFVGSLLSKMLNTGIVPFTTTLLPAAVSDALSNKYVRPFHGFIHIILGTVIASKVKNKYVKDAGIGLAALGGFDLLTQILSAVGATGLPTFSGMNVNLLGRTSYSTPGMSGMNVDFRGMSVDTLGNSRWQDAESDEIADNINDMIS